jgi:hypothetical protein
VFVSEGRERVVRISRPSKSADAARREEIERIRAMTPRERALLALELGEEMSGIRRRANARR